MPDMERLLIYGCNLKYPQLFYVVLCDSVMHLLLLFAVYLTVLGEGGGDYSNTAQILAILSATANRLSG